MMTILHFKKLVLALLIAGLSFSGWAQILYEGFDYPTPAFIGGNGDAGTLSNNWTTHSVTAGQITTINIEDGSLTYPGLLNSSGNKVVIFGNANASSRDVNRGFTSTAKILYFSALVNIVDKSQITATGDYFMHFASTAGTSVTSFGGRLGAKANAFGGAFRFIIQNTSGGTPTFTDNGTDLTFGTTYLVVVKFDQTTTPTNANMWINPSSLGGTEPAGFVSNNSGTSTYGVFASICLRNNATTPKANIDEIRVGETWASVTPISVGLKENKTSQRNTAIYPNPSNGWFNAEMPDKGTYIITIANTLGSTVKILSATSDKTMKIATDSFPKGLYFVTLQNADTKAKEVHKLLVR